MLNFRIIANVLGLLLLMVGVLMLLCLPVSLSYEGKDAGGLLLSAAITSAAGLGLWTWGGKRTGKTTLRKRDGFLIVTLGWILMSLFGALPFIISGAIPSYTNAFFETISGFTTTGASILQDIEAMPHGMLFWRSMTQWIGGMGIIVMTVAILPLLGIGGMELFLAEAPGPTKDKLHPRIKETAKRLWLIYVVLTAILTLLLLAGGMSLFDAVNHSFTTMATGGFSTHQQSIAYFNSPFIDYVLVVFMFIAGTNYTLIYLAVKGKIKNMFKNEEFKTYLLLCVIVTVVVTVLLYFVDVGEPNFEKIFRDALFQVVTIITTTGFMTSDYTLWPPFITMIFFGLLFLGGSAGSTSGGIKITRHLALVKNSVLELKRVIHPRAIIPVKINGRIVSAGIINNVLVFVLVYLLIFVIGSLILALIGLDFDTAIGAAATSLGNVGPGIGEVGPSNDFSAIPAAGKWILSALMLIGRLEIFTVLVIFIPFFWKTN